MKIQESAENYLETILVLMRKNGLVRAIDIAGELRFSKPSVSVAMKNLREHNFIETDAAGLISLTPKGMGIAEAMYERHVMLRDWLISLGVDADTASSDACRMEHVISKRTFDAIKRRLG